MKISFLIPAQTELDEAIEYYDEQRMSLGSEFSAKLNKRWIASVIILKLGRCYRRGYAVVWSIDFLTA